LTFRLSVWYDYSLWLSTPILLSAVSIAKHHQQEERMILSVHPGQASSKISNRYTCD
jgi:hypothetical protein